jgi:hypothetical protein
MMSMTGLSCPVGATFALIASGRCVYGSVCVVMLWMAIAMLLMYANTVLEGLYYEKSYFFRTCYREYIRSIPCVYVFRKAKRARRHIGLALTSLRRKTS